MTCRLRDRPVRISLSLALAASLACASAGCLTVVTETAKKAFEDRTTGNQATDAAIATSLMTSLTRTDSSLFWDVNVDVWEQRVMLTGTLTDPKAKENVLAFTRGDKRIKAFYDEIQLVSPEEQAKRKEAAEKRGSDGSEGFEEGVKDFWIASKINAKLLTEPEVRSVNFRWRVVRNTAYVIGRARSQAELDKLLDLIRATNGVGEVKHFVEVRPVS